VARGDRPSPTLSDVIRRPGSQAGKVKPANDRVPRALVAAAVTAVALAAALPAAGQAPAPGDPLEVVSKVARQSPAEVRRYWTPGRMRRAEPVELRRAATTPPPASTDVAAPRGDPKLVLPTGPGVPDTRAGLLDGQLGAGTGPQARDAVDTGPNNTGFPQRVHGRVFLTQGVEDFYCSGTVVRSPGHVLVWTAGHCVHGADIGQGFSTNFMFVPGYRDGQRPFGEWTAVTLHTTSEWRSSSPNNEAYEFDLGAATLARHGDGRGIQDEIGARGIAFNQRRSQPYSAFGYPVQSPFNGQRLYRCDSPFTGSDNIGSPAPMRIRCNMTGGASGGGWVADGRFVASVTSYGYNVDAECPAGLFGECLYGPYQGGAAKRLYQAARGKKRKCGGEEVTNLGGSGADDFDGTSGRDAFKLRRGADTGDGGAGGDRLCGGKGKDLLIGGPGRDVCNGGKGRDRARGCEERRKIP
jgi:V8-like Glu-specific endopeptidase